MSTHVTNFDAPDAKTRHDSVASSTVLVAMLLSALSGAFVPDVEHAVMLAANSPAPYIAVEEARP